ncbi:hypothetical protein OM317_12280 [Escherichia albertii]|nr:hypothetical protein [Escherichia albertii]MCZ8621130.1 hypothetical protein [Escherichia albertii]MCZ8642467.1 hypothetical protein [Escherichia albertii]MCZ8682109.1 hypothetical protein [Escherichia albertii]MCZ8694994.1 hypothetical protein [Escherichia albertii]
MTTNNHPAHGPVSLDRLHQIREILSKAAAQSDGGNLGYAMADAVKVIDGAIAAFGAEPVAWQWEYRDKRHVTNDQRRAKIVAADGEVLVQPLYTTPPAPVAMKAHQIRELVNDLRDIAIEYHGAQQLRERIARTVRAAMLQAGNSPVIGIDMASEPDRSVEVRYLAPPGYVMVPVEPTMEMLDEFDSIIDYGAEDSKDAWSRLISAAPQQEDRIQCCLTHPQTALQVHPFEMLMSLPPKPKMYCPECEPGVAERIDMMKNISSPKVGE